MTFAARRPLTQKELEAIVADLSDFEPDDKSDISEDEIIIEDYRQESEEDSDDDNVSLLHIQQQIGRAGSNLVSVTSEITHEAPSPTNNANLTTENNENSQRKYYFYIEDFPLYFFFGFSSK